MSRVGLLCFVSLFVLACASPQKPSPPSSPAPRGEAAPNPRAKVAPAKAVAFAKSDALERKRMASSIASLKEGCGDTITVDLDWAGYRKATGGGKFATHVCREALSMLNSVCWYTSRRFSPITKVRCEPGEGRVLSLEGKTLHVRTRPNGASGFTYLEKEFLALTHSSGKPLGELVARDMAALCLAGKNQILTLPRAMRLSSEGLFISDKSSLVRVPVVSHSSSFQIGKTYARTQSFSDRRYCPTRFGSDYQSVKIDFIAKTCRLQCGDRTKELKLADYALTQRVIRGATFRARPDVRRPYALARDHHGTYYYVDMSTLTKKHTNFRVYVGKRGKLRRQRMLDVVSDSEGEIFATKRGKLRLLVDKSAALWIAGRRHTKLKRVPITSNFSLIFKELGVYWGKRRYTPCDFL